MTRFFYQLEIWIELRNFSDRQEHLGSWSLASQHRPDIQKQVIKRANQLSEFSDNGLNRRREVFSVPGVTNTIRIDCKGSLTLRGKHKPNFWSIPKDRNIKWFETTPKVHANQLKEAIFLQLPTSGRHTFKTSSYLRKAGAVINLGHTLFPSALSKTNPVVHQW